MILRINGETVAYTLENEKVLAEVVRAMEAWLRGSGFAVTGIRADGRELPMASSADWETLPIESVAELDVKVSHGEDLRVEHWKTVSSWLALLAEEISGTGAALEELLAGFKETVDGIRQNPFVSAPAAGANPLEAFAAMLEGETSSSVASWQPARKREALARIEALREAVERRVESASRPRAALAACVGELRSCAAGLREVSVQLATGKDREAMEAVVKFTDALGALFPLLPLLPKDGERENLFTEMNGVLREVVAAFDARDSVLIGDLLEYEVTPRVEAILPLLSRYL